MKNLRSNQEQPEYFKVMENRIRYYAEKYDPHTLVHESDLETHGKQPGKRQPRRSNLASLYTLLLNIF